MSGNNLKPVLMWLGIVGALRVWRRRMDKGCPVDGTIIRLNAEVCSVSIQIENVTNEIHSTD